MKHAIQRLELKVSPAVIFILFVLFMWLIATFYPLFSITIPLRIYLTFFLFATGVLVGVYSLVIFYRFDTTVHYNKPEETSRLVTSGPYKHSRNPMYLSLSLVLIGWAVFLSDFLALMMMPVFYSYLTRFQIMGEERTLKMKFGKEYEDYYDKTPRWL